VSEQRQPMASEASVAEPAVLSARAGVALLTLQVRAALKEAAAAEAEAANWDIDASVASLRARLEPRVEERQRTLDEQLGRERTQAAEVLASARAEAARIVADAEERAAERNRLAERAAAAAALALVEQAKHAEQVTAEGALAEGSAVDTMEQVDITGEMPVIEAVVEQIDPPSIDTVPVDTAAVAALARLPEAEIPVAGTDPLVDPANVAALARLTALRSLVDELMRATAAGTPLPDVVRDPPESASIKVVIDADSFSKAFTTAIAAMMDERLAHVRAQPDPWASGAWRVVPTAAPVKKSFWAHAWHADVLLSLLAMVIVVVVLVAWST
jgi:phosphohistidine phosphatase SixA